MSYKNGAVLAESGNSSNNMKYRDYASSSNGGPRLRVAFMPVDYKGGGHSNPVYRSFVTPRVRLFFFRKTKNLVSHCKQTGKVLRFFVYIMPLYELCAFRKKYNCQLLIVMLLYFSGTGNSRWVANLLGKLLDERVYALLDIWGDELLLDLEEEEALGFVFPVYAWGPPALVSGFLSKVRANKIPSYVYFVCTCGDDTGKTADIFARAVQEKGWISPAGFSVIMPETYVCLPGFDVDPKDKEQKKLREAVGRIEDIARYVAARTDKVDCKEGRFPWIKSYLIRPLFNRFMTSAKSFHVTDACISCGKCVTACPLHNVRLEKKHPVWGQNCAMCLSCYHHCPKHAIEYGRMTKHKGQFTLER